MSISAISNLLSLASTTQSQASQQTSSTSTSTSVGVAAILDLSSTSAASTVAASSSTTTASDSNGGGGGGAASSTSSCPSGNKSCTGCGQCGKLSATTKSNTASQINLGAATANYQTLTAMNSYDANSIFL